MTSRIKEAIFSVFGEINLPSINTKVSPAEIIKWKNHPSIRECYKRLFKPIKSKDETTTYMHCILQKLWPKTDLKNIPDVWIAYTVGTAEILLNPKIPNIQVSETKMKPRLKKYMKIVVRL